MAGYAGSSMQGTIREEEEPTEEERQIYSQQRIVRRRIWQRSLALAIAGFGLLELVIIVASIVKPVPNFSLTGNLLYIQAREADQYSRRTRIPIVHTDGFSPPGLATLNVTVARDAASYPDFTIRQNRTNVNFARANRESKKLEDAGKFVAFWIGAMGICLGRASGSILCTGSISPDFDAFFAQSRLPKAVIDKLPRTTGGPAMAFLIGCICQGVFIGYLTLVTIWPRYIWHVYSAEASAEKKYQFVIGLVSFLALGAEAAFTLATIQLHNLFDGSVSAIPGVAPNLMVEWDGGFKNLYAGIIIGAIVVVACIGMCAWVRERPHQDPLPVQVDPATRHDLTRMIGAQSVYGGSQAGSAVR